MNRNKSKIVAIGLTLAMFSTTLSGCGVKQEAQLTTDNKEKIEEKNKEEDVIYVKDGNNWIPYYLFFNSMNHGISSNYSYAKIDSRGNYYDYSPSKNDFSYMKSRISKDIVKSSNSTNNSNTKTEISNNKNSSAKTGISSSSSSSNTVKPSIPKNTIKSGSSSSSGTISSFGSNSTRVSIGG